MVDDTGAPLRGDATYVVTVPAGLYKPYFSVTLYGSDNKLLIPNDLKIYDRTTFSSEPNQDNNHHTRFRLGKTSMGSFVPAPVNHESEGRAAVAKSDGIPAACND